MAFSLFISSHVLSKIAIHISIFHLGYLIYAARAPRARSLGRPTILWTLGKCALPVVIDCTRNFGGVGGRANIERHQTLIARNRHNRSDRVLGAAVYINGSLCSSGIVLHVWLSDGWNITAGRSLEAQANGGLSNHVNDNMPEPS